MSKKQNIFTSEYIIDGVHKELTPAQILAEHCPMAPPVSSPFPEEAVVDESLDPTPGLLDYNPSCIRKYLARTFTAKREFPVFFSGTYTRIKLARSLVDVLWHKGHFRLEDLSLRAVWHWDDSRMGNMAAFYDSVSEAADCLDSLGLTLRSYKCVPAEDQPQEQNDLSGQIQVVFLSRTVRHHRRWNGLMSCTGRPKNA